MVRMPSTAPRKAMAWKPEDALMVAVTRPLRTLAATIEGRRRLAQAGRGSGCRMAGSARRW
jgi:hypothetical protein